MRASFGVLAQLVAVAVQNGQLPVAAVQLAAEGPQPSLVGGRKQAEAHEEAAKQGITTEKVQVARQALAIEKVKAHHTRMEELVKYKTALEQLIREEQAAMQKAKSTAGIPSDKVEPSVVNLASENFTVRAAGQQRLIQIPRALSDSKLLNLRVDAVYEHLGSQRCGAAHMKSVSFFGNWTGNVGLVEIKAGSDQANTRMLIDTQPKFQGNSTSLEFGGITFLVEKKYDGRSGHPRSYLDVTVKGLKQQPRYDVGGILGLDDHTHAELPGEGCLSAQASSTGASTAMIETGSSADAASAGSRAVVMD